MSAPRSSTDVQPKEIMEEWKVASFKEHIMKQSREVFLQTKINDQYAAIPSAKRKNEFYFCRSCLGRSGAMQGAQQSDGLAPQQGRPARL